jgi:hypothetical protein
MASLPYVLSAEDTALLESLQDTALLSAVSLQEVRELAFQKKAEQEKKMLLPYADLLEMEILTELSLRKQSILNKLKESPGMDFTVELLSWNTVFYREDLTELLRRESLMTREELRDHNRAKRVLQESLTTFGKLSVCGTEMLHHDEYETYRYIGLPEVKVERIFRKTDLRYRIAMALGPNFFPYLCAKMQEGVSEDGPHGYTGWTTTLCVRYYPKGLSKNQMTTILKTLKDKKQRQEEGTYYTLQSMEELNRNSPGLTYSLPRGPVALQVPAPIRVPALRELPCFCGCADPRGPRPYDEEEE